MASHPDIESPVSTKHSKKRGGTSISDDTTNFVKIFRDGIAMNSAKTTLREGNGKDGADVDIFDMAPPPLPPSDDMFEDFASGENDVDAPPCENSGEQLDEANLNENNETKIFALQMDEINKIGNDATINNVTLKPKCSEVQGMEDANCSDNIAREAKAFRNYLKSKSAHENASADVPSNPTVKNSVPSVFISLNKNEDHSNLVNAFQKRLFDNPTPTLKEAYNHRDAAATKRKIIRERKKQVLAETQQLRDEILKLREQFRKKKENLLNVNSMLKQSSKEVGWWNKVVFDLELQEPCTWNQKLQLLKDYTRENGSPPPLNVTQTSLTPEERKINKFIKGIKKKVEQNHPSMKKYPHRKRAIEDLGIPLAISEKEKERHFEFMLKKLIDYKREHGTYRMPKYDVIKSSGNDNLLLLHNWIFTEVSTSIPSHTQRFREIGFSFDNWCGVTTVQSTTQDSNSNTKSKRSNKSQKETPSSTPSSKHNGVRDLVRLAIINFLSTRHKNGRIQHGAIKEAVKKFGYSDSGIKIMWEKHKVGILDPSKGIDVRNRHGAGRKCKYDVDEIRRVLIGLQPAKQRTINEIAEACGVPGKSTMHRLLYSDPELLKLARNAGLTVKSKRTVQDDDDERGFCQDWKQNIPMARVSERNNNAGDNA